MRIAIGILVLLLSLPLLSQEPSKSYVNAAYRFSFDYPANFQINEDPAQLRQLMDMGNDLVDTSKMTPEVRAAMEHIGPQFLLASPARAVMVCITTPLSEPQLAVPTLELARLSLKQAIDTIPGTKVVSDPVETLLGSNHLVRYELEMVVQGEVPTRQVQYMVRNSDLRVLYLFGVTADSASFPTDVIPFETILKGLKLDFATGDRGQG